MTAGGGVLTPSSAGAQIIHLASRLVVGVRLHGTIAAFHPRTRGQLKCRPFLRYFAETLHRLRCDVTLFVPVNSRTGPQRVAELSTHEFPCEYRVVHDPTSGAADDCGRGQRRGGGGASRGNFQDLLSRMAAEQQTSPSRILFIESEINYRFSPVQTLVVEAFQPHRIRQRRRSMGEAAEAEERRQAGEHHAALLESEYSWTQGGRASRLRHAQPSAPFSAELHGDPQEEAKKDDVRSAALAINREDYTLVALAGMLVELAAADVAVADYLRVEPLVEKLTVPFHGEVNYLPMENCDDMELWDWDAVEVREARRKEEAETAVPEVEEREEHRDLFK
ncbi:hypothetical protein TcG_05860 [Trypanosoma cruzi]|uniref:Uncharacterized protein n=2 Tax=Trypanosoma cruzi TaxID=5693 RepID=V5DJG9_TRYCR|nr:hypothetical protein TCDM_03807 [Trypanosoma cruzi Dm28c]PWU94261.1 hypothetical protein C4B63_27g218 [Trypanosoma cruzi]RNF17315.1 hypothetical protein TcG_05860 [Trypanosoma cruzi]